MRYVEFQELNTTRLYLRKIGMDDLEDYYRFTGDPEVTKYMNFQTHQDLLESAASIEKWAARYASRRSYHWGIALKDTGRLIGVIDLLSFNAEKSCCSFAYMLGKDFWGQGYGTEALAAVVAFAFTRMEMEIIEADHFLENTGSGAVMRKAGMTYQETIPGKYEKDGISHDAVRYAITRDSWLTARK